MSTITEIVFPEIHRIAREAKGELVARQEVIARLIERLRPQLEQAWESTTQYGAFDSLEAYTGNLYDHLTGPQWARSGGGLRKERLDGQWAIASNEAPPPSLSNEARERIAARRAERRRDR